MLCPLCKVPLQAAERFGVEIDFCLQCRGVWLDRGELDKIIERAAHDHIPNAYHDGDFPQYEGSEHPRIIHLTSGKKNNKYLEDLFDFDD